MRLATRGLMGESFGSRPIASECLWAAPQSRRRHKDIGALVGRAPADVALDHHQMPVLDPDPLVLRVRNSAGTDDVYRCRRAVTCRLVGVCHLDDMDWGEVGSGAAHNAAGATTCLSLDAHIVGAPGPPHR